MRFIKLNVQAYNDLKKNDFREQNPRPFKSSGKSKKDDSHGMQRTNPSFVPEPGVNDDLVYGKVKCDNDQEKYYNPRCFTFEGSGNLFCMYILMKRDMSARLFLS